MKRLGLALGLCCCLGLTGCLGPQTRLLSEEETQRDKDLDVKTIGEVTEVAGAGFQQVSGVGLVTGLDGTGGSPTGQFRTMLEQDLRKQKVDNVKALLDSPDNALVLVSAMIPAGARKGDPVDIEITLPPGSKATSLRGGYLQLSLLRNYETTQKMNPTYEGSNKLLPGHVLAKAKGNLIVGLGNRDEPAELRRARIWEGGTCLADRPFYLVMKNDDKSARVAGAVAERINYMFQDDVRKQQSVMQHKQLYVLNELTQQLNQTQDSSGGQAAKAMNKEVIAVRIPYSYRFNPQRYLRVARLMPLREAQEQRGPYRQRLEKMLLDPRDTVRAALRLEALGKESIPTLKKGLASEHHLVRFAAAEALTYLGNTSGVPELAQLVVHYPLFRNFGLAALASLDENVCREKLAELLVVDDAEMRCGAFFALRLIDGTDRTDRRLGGAHVGEVFWLHQVAPGAAPLVHVAVSKRAEVVLFGSDAMRLVRPMKILAGEFVVTAEDSDDRCTISRISARHGVQRHQSSLQLGDVLKAMVELGAGYPDLVELIRKLDDRQNLNCPVAFDVVPADFTLEDLVEEGRQPMPPADSNARTPPTSRAETRTEREKN